MPRTAVPGTVGATDRRVTSTVRSIRTEQCHGQKIPETGIYKYTSVYTMSCHDRRTHTKNTSTNLHTVKYTYTLTYTYPDMENLQTHTGIGHKHRHMERDNRRIRSQANQSNSQRVSSTLSTGKVSVLGKFNIQREICCMSFTFMSHLISNCKLPSPGNIIDADDTRQ